jgi:hypothetical protein
LKRFSDAVVKFRQESGLEYEEEIKREDLFFDCGQQEKLFNLTSKVNKSQVENIKKE